MEGSFALGKPAYIWVSSGSNDGGIGSHPPGGVIFGASADSMGPIVERLRIYHIEATGLDGLVHCSIGGGCVMMDVCRTMALSGVVAT